RGNRRSRHGDPRRGAGDDGSEADVQHRLHPRRDESQLGGSVFNSRNFCGTDGTLVLSDPVGLDGAVFTSFWGESGVVGRVTNVSLAVTTDVKPFYELGSRSAKELRAGYIAISGT